MEALNIDVRVRRGGQLLYTATTWAGYIGLLTAQRPGHYAVAVNFREQGEGTECRQELPLPVGLAVRLAMERSRSYNDFVEFVASVPSMAPFYCLVVSASGEAVQVTRNAPCGEVGRRELEEEGAYIVQANMDYWDTDPANDTQQSLVRCQLAETMLQAAAKKGVIEESDLWMVLWKDPIFERGVTLYSSVMNPARGTFHSLSEPPEDDPGPQRAAGKRRKSRK
ncbi:ASAH1 [Symbiodinium natans]|uniref:ceramidase n=1 Tax=Symbiodinium natans TaxID=878477 RepID=A0A812UGJ9_9DINO|nr:ASAH1 [Symbiodinium natans]